MRLPLLAATIVLAVCAAASVLQAAPPSRPVTVIQGAEPEGLDASITTGVLSLNPALHILEPLVDFDEHLRIVPKLAAAWKWVDATTLEMTIRAGVKFHDGTPLTAGDVKFTFDRILDPKNRSDFRRYFNERVVKAVQAPSAGTVRFALAEPRPVFVRTLTQVGIVPSKAITDLGRERFARAPVGNRTVPVQGVGPGGADHHDGQPGVLGRDSAHQGPDVEVGERRLDPGRRAALRQRGYHHRIAP